MRNLVLLAVIKLTIQLTTGHNPVLIISISGSK